MRLSNYFLAFFCLAHILAVTAQTDSKVEWGEAFISGKSREIHALISDSEQAYYFVNKTTNPNDLGTLTKLDSQLNLISQKPFTGPKNSKVNTLSHASIYMGQLSMIWRSNKDKAVQFVSQKYNPSTLAMEGGLTPITETFPGHGLIIVKTNTDYGELMKSVSRDFSKRVYSYAGPDFTAKNASFGISVTDQKDNMLYSAEFKHAQSTSDLNRMGVAVGNDGTSYVLTRLVNDQNDDASTELRIWKFGSDGSNQGDVSVSFQSKYISKIGMQVAPDGSVICAGTFSYKNLSGAQGTVYIKIDGKDLSVTQKKVEDFQSALIENSSGSNRLKGYKLVKFQGPFILENGNTVIGIEQYEGNVAPLVYRDILVFEFGAEGGSSKTGIIRKEQNGSDNYFNYLSYKLVTKGNKAHVVYTDLAKNTDTPGNEKHSKCIITGYNPVIVAELSTSGFVKNQVSYSKKEKMRASIAEIRQTQEGNLIFMQNQISGNKSKMQFGRLEL